MAGTGPFDVSVNKTVAPTNPALGDIISYRVVITNRGASGAGTLVIQDLLPTQQVTYVSHSVTVGTYVPGTGLWSLGNVNAGLSHSLFITGQVKNTAVGFVTNIASYFSSSTSETNAANNVSTALFYVATADLGVGKSASPPSPYSGSVLTYSISITNHGPEEVSTVNVRDVLPSGVTYVGNSLGSAYNPTSGIWTVGSLAVSEVKTLDITVLVSAGAGATITNVASITNSTAFDAVAGNNTRTSLVTVAASLGGIDFGVSKISNLATADVAQLITFTIAITNFGPSTATNILVLDQLPTALSFDHSSDTNYNPLSGIWNVGTLNPGEFKSMEIFATVTEAAKMKLFTNTASLLSAGGFTDTNAANNSASRVIQGGRGADHDLTFPPVSLQTIPAGSYIIPMDLAHQALISPFNMKAYGLINSLLASNVPVIWAISSGKTNGQVDFVASTTRIFPTAQTTPSNRSFRSGAYIVTPSFTNRASPVISSWGNSVAVYRTLTNQLIDVRYTLTTKPQIIILDVGNNVAIHSNVLVEAGIPSGQITVRSGAQIATLAATSCFTIITSPHYADATDGDALAIRGFVENGGNFLAQCHAVLNFEDNASGGRFMTTLGGFDRNDNGPFLYPNADSAYSQIDGILISGPGGSLEDFDLNPGSQYKEPSFPVIRKSSTSPTGSVRAVMSKLHPGGLGSLVFYLGGHSYGNGTVEAINGRRLYMNAVLMPSGRPEECGFSFGTDLVVTKNDFRTFVLQDQVTTYQIVVSNRGPVSVTGATVEDIFPPEITVATWTNQVFGGATVPTNAGSGSISQIVSMPVGSRIVYFVNATMGFSPNGLISNVVTVTPPIDIIETNPDNNRDDDVNIIIAPAINLQKTVSDVGASPGVEVVTGTNGQAVLYSFVLRNDGDVTITNVVLSDVLLTYTTNLPDLAVGQSYTVTHAAVISGSLTNTAVASGQDIAGNNHTDNDTAAVIAISPAINIEKTVSDDGTFVSSGEFVAGTNGQAVTYFFVVSNIGNVTLTNVAVNDPDVPFTTNIGTLVSGQSVTVSVADALSGSLTNTATASGVDQLGNIHTDSDTAEVEVFNPDINIEKTVSANGTFASSVELVTGTNGQLVTYFFVVSNPGDVTLTNVVVNDPNIPFNTVIGTLLVGQSVTVSVNDVISGDLTNTATASGNDPRGNLISDDDTAEVVEINPSINIEKTVDDDDTIFGSEELIIGTNNQAVTYFFVVQNNGDVTLTNVVVTDTTITPNYTTNIGTLAAGQSVTVQTASTISGNLTNTASVVGQDSLGNSHTDSDTAEVQEFHPAIAVEKTVSDSNFPYPGVDVLINTNGTPIIYWFLVSNTGDTTLTNITLVDFDLPFTTNLGTLLSGQSVTVSVSDVLNNNLTNTVTATGFDTIGKPHNDSDIAEVIVVGPAIGVVKTVSKDGSYPGVNLEQGTNGTPVTYWIVVENQGDCTLTNVTLSDVDLSYSTNLGTLAAGQSVTVSLAGVISADLTNTAVAMGFCESNFQPYQDSDIAIVDLVAPGITIEKTVSDDGTFNSSGELVVGTNGQQVTYFFVIMNVGDVLLTNVVVDDSDIIYNLVMSTLAPGESETVSVVRTISGDLTNTVTVSGYDPFGDSHFDEDTAEVAEINPSISIVKLVDGVNLVIGTNGQSVVYSFQVINDGDVALTNVSLIDNDLTPPINQILGDLAAGQSVTVEVNSVISGSLTNVATASAEDPLGNTHEDDDDAEVREISPAISIEKTVSDDGTFASSVELVTGTNAQAVTYFFVVSNGGDVTLTNVTVVDNTIVPPYTNVIGTLLAGQSVTVSTATVISGDLVNTATVTGEDVLGNVHTDDDTAEVEEINPAINIEKTVSDDGTFANSSELVTGTNAQSVTYFFVISNIGDVTLTNVAVLDLDLIPNFTTNIGTLAAGQSVTVSTTTVISGDLQNSATASGEDELGNVHTDDDTANVEEINPAINIEKTVSDDGTFASSGELVTGTNDQAVTYFFVVSNFGDVTLTNVTVVDNTITPPYTNVIGTLLAGQSVTVSVTTVISGELINTATASGQDELGNTHSDNDTAEVRLTDSFLIIDKDFVTASEPDQNGNFSATYIITVHNSGGKPDTYDLVEDPQPDTNSPSGSHRLTSTSPLNTCCCRVRSSTSVYTCIPPAAIVSLVMTSYGPTPVKFVVTWPVTAAAFSVMFVSGCGSSTRS